MTFSQELVEALLCWWGESSRWLPGGDTGTKLEPGCFQPLECPVWTGCLWVLTEPQADESLLRHPPVAGGPGDTVDTARPIVRLHRTMTCQGRLPGRDITLMQQKSLAGWLETSLLRSCMCSETQSHASQVMDRKTN